MLMTDDQKVLLSSFPSSRLLFHLNILLPTLGRAVSIQIRFIICKSLDHPKLLETVEEKMHFEEVRLPTFFLKGWHHIFPMGPKRNGT